MTNARTSRQKRLHLSIGGFGVLAAVLSLGFFFLLTSLKAALFLPAITPSSVTLAVSATLAVSLTGMLFWWLFIVFPNRLTLLRGVLAGIVSIICAIPLMWVFIGVYLVLIGYLPFTYYLGIVLYGTLLSFVFLFFPVVGEMFPWWIGWFMLLIGGSAGGMYALLLRRIFHVTDEVEHREL